MSQAIEALVNRGKDHQRANQLDAAAALYRQVLATQPDHHEVLYLLGVIHHQSGRSQDAVAAIAAALKLCPSEEYYNTLGTIYLTLNQYQAAAAAFRSAIALNPTNAGSAINLGAALLEARQVDEALSVLRRAVALDPRAALAHFNLGNALRATGNLDAAIASYQTALALRPAFPEALTNLGNAYGAQNRLDEAIAVYREATRLKPDLFGALNNLANALQGKRDFEGAIAAYRQAIEHAPEYAEAYNNLATALQETGRIDEAVAAYRRALALKPHYPEAHYQLVTQLKKLCLWDGLAELERSLIAHVREGRPGVSPLSMCMQASTPADQLTCARFWSASYESLATPFPPRTPGRGGGRIRVGYLSPDFRDHAVSFLIAEMIERHDRSRFDIYGYSFGRDDGSVMRRRMARGFDRFVDVAHLSHYEIAQVIDRDQVDILVDLTGYTGGSRTAVLAFHPAPIQVNFLGFPCTMGAGFMDYMIADRFCVPVGEERHYSEKLVFLPSYQPNDSTRRISTRPITRADCFLPDEGFVFASFNNSYKITPEFFDVWMRLLRAVPGSVLWLKDANASLSGNLRREAAARGVAPERLVFAPGLALHEEHLARQRCADLFLDTLPYNAHTTASDALWAGMPMVTCVGGTFAGRVAGSVLTALGVPELITWSVPEYEALALHLAQSPDALAAIRAKIAAARDTAPLYDIGRYTLSIEEAYRRMWETWQAGRPPESFEVGGVTRSDAAAAPRPVTPPPPDPALGARFAEAVGHHVAGRAAEAVAAYQAVLALDPNHGEARHHLGVLHHARGDHVQAVEEITRAIAVREDEERWNHLGSALLALGRVEEALAACRTALALNPAYGEGQSNYGAALLQAGRIDDAFQAFSRAVALSPNLPVAHFNLGVVLRLQGRSAEAAAPLRQALALKPDFAAARTALAEVEAVVAPAANEAGSVIDTLFQQAVQHHAAGRYDQARADYERLLVLKPDHGDAQHHLGLIHHQRGDHQQAVRLIEASLLSTRNGERYSNLGNALLALGRIDEALDAYRAAIGLEPDKAWSYANLSSALVGAGRAEEAAAACRRALGLDPNLLVAHYNLGVALHRLGQGPEAAASFRRALVLKPDFAEARHALTVVEGDRGARPAGDAGPRRKEARVRTVPIAGAVLVCVPDDLTLITPYVLVEQADWFEPEVQFIRTWAEPGLAAIDIGANYGVYTLTLAKCAGGDGRVWAYEPARATADYLERSVAANKFTGVEVVRAALSDHEGTATLFTGANAELNTLHGEALASGGGGGGETVALTTLDAVAQRVGGRAIGFVKIDAEGEEANVLRGGRRFFAEQSPLVMFEIKHGAAVHLDLADRFAALGYGVFRLVPGLLVLEPFVRGRPVDPFQLNLFAAKPDCAARLAARGLLVDAAAAAAAAAAPSAAADGADEDVLFGDQLWASAFRPGWRRFLAAGGAPGWGDHGQALAAFQRSRRTELPVPVRLAALRRAEAAIERALAAGPGNVSRLCSAARIAAACGERGTAVAVLDRLHQLVTATAPAMPEEPFLPVAASFETLDPGERWADWLGVGVTETLERLGAHSSYFAPDRTRALLGAVSGRSFVSAESERRLRLIAIRQAAAVAAAAAVPAEGVPAATVGTSLVDLLPAPPPVVRIVDIGAMLIGDPPYAPLLARGLARVVGFEPNPEECAKLNQVHGESHQFYPFFIGDGAAATYHETCTTMTGSLFRPNFPLLDRFGGLSHLLTLVAEHPVKTHRLDDIAALGDVDMIKIDIQGAELAAFRGGERVLAGTVLIQTEVEFVPLYENQPLFAEVDQYLRARGFQFYSFLGYGTRCLKPFLFGDQPHRGLHQMLWSDVVYIPTFETIDTLSDDKLVKLAILAHELYGFFDLAAHALQILDRRRGSGLVAAYLPLVRRLHPTLVSLD